MTTVVGGTVFLLKCLFNLCYFGFSDRKYHAILFLHKFLPGADCCSRGKGAVRTPAESSPTQGQGPRRGLQGAPHQIRGGHCCKCTTIIMLRVQYIINVKKYVRYIY